MVSAISKGCQCQPSAARLKKHLPFSLSKQQENYDRVVKQKSLRGGMQPPRRLCISNFSKPLPITHLRSWRCVVSRLIANPDRNWPITDLSESVKRFLNFFHQLPLRSEGQGHSNRIPSKGRTLRGRSFRRCSKPLRYQNCQGVGSVLPRLTKVFLF